MFKSHVTSLNTSCIARGYPTTDFIRLGEHIGQRNLADLVRQFLYIQLNPDDLGSEPVLDDCPELWGVSSISVFHLARATFCAPSDLSGIGGMHTELIRSNPLWKKGSVSAPRRDCIYVANTLGDSEDTCGMQGLLVARVLLFFSFQADTILYPCALVHWYKTFGDGPDPDTGMWIVEPEYDENNFRSISVIHIDTILRAAHLLPIFDGDTLIDRSWHFTRTLDIFRAFYVNKYIDHHAFETAF